MKIVCNKNEFAALVRSCVSAETLDTCRGCFFTDMCATGSNYEEGVVFEMNGIEDICEVREDG